MNAEAISILQAQRKSASDYRDAQAKQKEGLDAQGAACAAEIDRMETRIKAIDAAIKQLSEGK